MEKQDQFTNKTRLLTFTNLLDKNTLQKLQNQKCISHAMFNQSTVNLSGSCYKNWKYSGKACKADQLSYFQTLLNQVNSSTITKQDQKKSMLNLKNVPFIELIKRADWKKINIMFEVHQNKDVVLFKQLSCIEFPRLTNLCLSANNIDSIELLQTMQFPNLQQLDLSFNKITNAHSLEKISCINIMSLRLRANFLNSNKTFQGFTKINSPNLKYTSLEMQNDNRFLADIQGHINLNLNLIQQPINQPTTFEIAQIQQIREQPYLKLNQVLQMNRLQQRYWVELQKHQLHVDGIFNDYANEGYKLNDIFNHLREQTLYSLQYRFLLKSNSLTQQILSNKPNATYYKGNGKYTPYQYYVDYGTEIYAFCEYMSKDDMHDYVEQINPRSPAVLALCSKCQHYKCKCQQIYAEQMQIMQMQMQDQNKVWTIKGANRYQYF